MVSKLQNKGRVEYILAVTVRYDSNVPMHESMLEAKKSHLQDINTTEFAN